MSQDTTPTEQGPTSFADLGREMWSYLTGKQATIEYTFVDMTVEVPRETGASAPRATWKVDGTVRIRTADGTAPGSLGK